MPHPLRVTLVVPYGAAFGALRAGGRTHQGTDYHAPEGTPIYGTGDGGVVQFIGYNGDARLGLGHNVRIGYPGARVTVDAHLRERSPLKIGDQVGPNTLVGYVGHTGNAVNADPQGPWHGNHDHHECRVNGVLVNPFTLYGDTLAAANVGTPFEEDDMTEAQYKELERIGNENWRIVTAAWAEAKEAARVAQANWVLLQGIVAAQKDDATEASVKEAIRVAQATWETTQRPSIVTLPPEATKNIAQALAAQFGVKFDQVRESLGKLITEQVGADEQAIAIAAADEADRRERERLGK